MHNIKVIFVGLIYFSMQIKISARSIQSKSQVLFKIM